MDKLQYVPPLYDVNSQNELVLVPVKLVDTGVSGSEFVVRTDSQDIIGVLEGEKFHSVGERVRVSRDEDGKIAPGITRPGKGKIMGIQTDTEGMETTAPYLYYI